MTASDPERLRPRWHAAAAGVTAVGIVISALVWFLGQERPLTGTNSIAPRYAVGTVKPGERLCDSDLHMTGDTNVVTMRFQGTGRPVPLTVTVSAAGRTQTSHAVLRGSVFSNVDFHFSPVHRTGPAKVCLATPRAVVITGQPQPGPVQGTTVNGKPINARVTIWFQHLPARSLASDLPRAWSRAALFRAGFVGAWTYVALAAIVVLLWFAAARLMRRSL